MSKNSQQRIEARRKTADELKTQMAEIARIEDPAARLLAWEDFKPVLENAKNVENSQRVNLCLSRLAKIYGGGTALSLGGIYGTGIVLASLSLQICALPAFAAISGVTIYIAEKHKKALLKEAKPFLDAVAEMKESIDAAQKGIIETELPAVRQSPRMGDALSKVPGLKDAFAKAFVNAAPASSRAPVEKLQFKR